MRSTPGLPQMRKPSPRVLVAGMPVGVVALVLLMAILATNGWSHTLYQKRLLGWHETVIGGIAPAPDQYRVLTPALADVLFWWIGTDSVEAVPMVLQQAYFVLHLIAFTVTGLFFVPFCRRWLSLQGSLLSAALLMAVSAVANIPDQIQVTDPLNLMFVTIGLWAIQRDRLWLLLVTMLVGAINRESILVLAGYLVLMQWERPRRTLLLSTLLAALAWGVAYGGLRLLYGTRAHYVDVVMLGYNLQHVWHWAPPLVLLAPLIIAALQRSVAQWPGQLRRAVLVVPPYLLLHLTIARIEEVRLFLPLMPILIPLAVLGIAGPAESDMSEEATRGQSS